MTVTIETIEAAARRLQGVVIETPLLINRYLNDKLNAKVFIKPECLQHIGAFKFRGAYNRLSQLSDEQRKLGCVAFSSGNHAQGIALAAKLLEMQATIVKIAGDMPTMCDALMATTPGELTWSINSKTVDEFLVVDEEEVMMAIAYAFRYLKLVVEPGGSVALAALLSGKLDITGKTVCIVLSGGNIDKETLNRCIEKYPD